MSEEKRKRGRPRKKPIDHNALLEAAEKFNREHNPDCEPATKGYVKYIARKLYGHTHSQRVSHAFTPVLVIILWCAFGMSLFGFGTSPNILPIGWYDPCLTLLVGALIGTFILVDNINTENYETLRDENWYTQNAIAKYQPPTYEKKNECE